MHHPLQVILFLAYCHVSLLNCYGQEIPRKLTGISDTRMADETLLRFRFDILNGKGIRHYDPELGQWLTYDEIEVPTVSLPFLTSMSCFSTSYVKNQFKPLKGSWVDTDNWIVWERENQIESNRDYYRLHFHKTDWRSIFLGVGDSISKSVDEFEDLLQQMIDYGYAVETECGYLPNSRSCSAYMVRVGMGETMIFNIERQPNIKGYEHPTERFPKSVRIFSDVYTYQDMVVKRFENAIEFNLEGGEIVCDMSFGNCTSVPMTFDTGATITLFSADLLPCLKATGNLKATGEYFRVQTADGSSSSVERYVYNADFDWGGYTFSGFDCTFMSGGANLIGESIWGQFSEFSIDRNKQEITFKK